MLKTAKAIICVLLAVFVLAGCGSTAPSTTTEPATTPTEGEKEPTMDEIIAQIAQLGTSPDDNYRVWYEVFVYSFCDSNGDGIGDLRGVTSKLDYLQELGINGIWLMPIHPSTTYHKYNVGDYYAIDPEYGTMADFDELIAECNKRGIKVILDLVVNHTGSDHKWFKALAEYLQFVPADMEFISVEECPYVDYYNIKTTGGSGYSRIPNTDFYYECQFSSDMPDLNLGSELVREEIRKIMEFWLGKGVAGFRVDAAKEFYSGNTAKNVEVLNWLQTTAAELKPDVYMVAEVWDSFSTINSYYTSGFTSIFNYPFGNNSGRIIKALRAAGRDTEINGYAKALADSDAAFYASNPNYIDAPFLSNHDVGRIAGFVNRDKNKVKLAGAMNLFMSGSAFIYYGEEIGMVGSGDDPSKRAPMLWNEQRNDGTTNVPPGCTLPEEYPFPSLEQQREDVTSIYNYYRQAVAIRKALPVISHGKITVESALNAGCISAQRKTWNDESCIILMNINPEAASVDLSAYADWKLAATLSADGSAIEMDGTTLNIGAYGVAVLIPNA